MGEAKRRGTYEERKAQAIARGPVEQVPGRITGRLWTAAEWSARCKALRPLVNALNKARERGDRKASRKAFEALREAR